MIDWARVTQLRDEIGADDFDEVAELFLLEVEDTLSRLDAARDDVGQMQELLHFLKGAALNLGFGQVAGLCGAGESNVSDGRLRVDIAALKSLYAQSRAAFEDEYHTRFAA